MSAGDHPPLPVHVRPRMSRKLRFSMDRVFVRLQKWRWHAGSRTEALLTGYECLGNAKLLMKYIYKKSIYWYDIEEKSIYASAIKKLKSWFYIESHFKYFAQLCFIFTNWKLYHRKKATEDRYFWTETIALRFITAWFLSIEITVSLELWSEGVSKRANEWAKRSA